MIQRILLNNILKNLNKGKAIIILGPRQVGKTTLLEMLKKSLDCKVLYLNGDEPDIRNILTDTTSTELKHLINKNKVVMIDEAQRIKNIGLTLKIIVDQIKDTQLIVTGSSSFELSNQIKEPLTGRAFIYNLYPVSIEENVKYIGESEEKRLLKKRLIYGCYPEVITKPGNEKELLINLSDSYLYKDIFSYQDIRKPELIQKLVQLIALQIGSEVSLNELAQTVGADFSTIERYLGLLEKAFVIFRLRSFSRNIRNELKKSRKIYFFDNGIRNAVIANFSSLEIRVDAGYLWENYMVSERIKFLHYNQLYTNVYFWRTTQQQEVDFIEDRDGKLYAYEFKLNPKKKVKFPKTFAVNYPDTEFLKISQDNYINWLIS